ncbi:torso-like protein [Venturia canescens]|uniref:torso-like protein n=1 Tax=Venturia canescens TaxID=32260 RepID=UPI001C9D35DD|nr:torso-like protein [Venturia canescens]
MCNNLDELFHGFFRGLEVEGVSKPWHIFSEKWAQNEIADYFGIHQHSYLDDDRYCYLLVTIDRIRDSQGIASPLEDLHLDEAVVKNIGSMDDSEFQINFGSHYIDSYSTGNSVYQILVFEKHFYEIFNSTSEDSKLQYVIDLATKHANVLYYGTIKTSSGNRTVEAWANENSYIEKNTHAYASLFDLVNDDESKSRYLYALLGDEVMMQLKLRSVVSPLEVLRKKVP